MATLTPRHTRVARGRDVPPGGARRLRAAGLGALAVFVALACALSPGWMAFVLARAVIRGGRSVIGPSVVKPRFLTPTEKHSR
jgi:hypothetical protein